MSPNVQIRAMGEDVELSIQGAIGADFFGAGFTARDIETALRECPAAKTIKLRINSPGGDALEGVAIHAMLAGHPARVEASVEGVAASAATIVVMAADDIAIAEGSMFMVHDAWVMTAGNAAELRAMAERLDKVSEQYAAIYSGRTGMSEDDVRGLMTAGIDGTWLTAAEAVEMGFADRLTTGKRKPEQVEQAIAAASRFLPWMRRFAARPQTSAAETAPEQTQRHAIAQFRRATLRGPA